MGMADFGQTPMVRRVMHPLMSVEINGIDDRGVYRRDVVNGFAFSMDFMSNVRLG